MILLKLLTEWRRITSLFNILKEKDSEVLRDDLEDTDQTKPSIQPIYWLVQITRRTWQASRRNSDNKSG